MNLQDSISANSDTLSNAFTAFDAGKLYEPDPVRFSFETIGWPVLGGLVFLGLLIAGFIWFRHYHRSRYRREALKRLNLIRQDQALEIFVVLKRTAIHAFGRENVGTLAGTEWLKFLESTGKNVRMLGQEKQIRSVIYQNEPLPPDAHREIVSNAKLWVKTHAVKL